MIWLAIQSIRAKAPLVLNITNYVVMNSTANALLALGASPIMAHALDEMEEMTGIVGALVINIGTLSPPWIDSMLMAGRAARRKNIPIVLDPVGSGATQFRTATALKLIEEIGPTIVRGNASEIRSLVRSDTVTKGVDSQHTSDEVAQDARALSRDTGCVVVVSGAVDLIVAGDKVARVSNGHSMMTRVTGLGCTASALTGAFAAVSHSPFEAAVGAMAVMGIAGEMAVEESRGPGSLQMNFLDALYRLQASDIATRLKADFAG